MRPFALIFEPGRSHPCQQQKSTSYSIWKKSILHQLNFEWKQVAYRTCYMYYVNLNKKHDPNNVCLIYAQGFSVRQGGRTLPPEFDSPWNFRQKRGFLHAKWRFSGKMLFTPWKILFFPLPHLKKKPEKPLYVCIQPCKNNRLRCWCLSYLTTRESLIAHSRWALQQHTEMGHSSSSFWGTAIFGRGYNPRLRVPMALNMTRKPLGNL